MNNVDRQYLALMQEILDKGTLKHTRAGDTLSLFGKTMEFNLQEGLPLLTTKKVFYKGAIYELLWFLKGDTNIKYLVDNNIHIWDDDAYRWFKSLDFKTLHINNLHVFSYKNDDSPLFVKDADVWYEIAVGDYTEKCTEDTLKTMTKETFLQNVKNKARIVRHFEYKGKEIKTDDNIYTFGDLGPVYGKQWRGFGRKFVKGVDQIQKIINTLKTNPDDRRMLCTAFNPDVLDDVALPPCHMMFQFYARDLTCVERNGLIQGCNPNKELSMEELDALDVPKKGLSISLSMRSNDYCLGNPLNIFEYAVLCHIIANMCNMMPDKLIYFGGDVHIYTNQIDGCKEQLQRKGSDILPTLIIKRKFNSIDDINYDDFQIIDYYPDPVIKFPLSVG